jgi:hypothetical protein
MISSNVFTDHGFQDDIFQQQFISQQFTVQSLRELLPSSKGNQSKVELVQHILEAINNGQLTPDEILLNYVKRSRMWLSFKLGKYTQLPNNLKPASQLIDSFGEEGWYGPVIDKDSRKVWLIRTFHIDDKYYAGSTQIRQASTRKLRWTVFAELTPTYVALSWHGFTFSSNPDKRSAQFPFWYHVPTFFEELTVKCGSEWSEPDFYALIMDTLWQKYNENSMMKYSWRHIRIRAESSGVALNASSSGIADMGASHLCK